MSSGFASHPTVTVPFNQLLSYSLTRYASQHPAAVASIVFVLVFGIVYFMPNQRVQAIRDPQRQTQRRILSALVIALVLALFSYGMLRWYATILF